MLEKVKANLRRVGLAPVGPMVAGLAPFATPDPVISWIFFALAIYVTSVVFYLLGNVRSLWGVGLFYFATMLFLYPFGPGNLSLAIAYVGLAIVCGRKFSQQRASK